MTLRYLRSAWGVTWITPPHAKFFKGRWQIPFASRPCVPISRSSRPTRSPKVVAPSRGHPKPGSNEKNRAGYTHAGPDGEGTKKQSKFPGGSPNPASRRADVTYLNAPDPGQPYGYNPLRHVGADRIALAASG